jgi:hypothetical protein
LGLKNHRVAETVEPVRHQDACQPWLKTFPLEASPQSASFVGVHGPSVP